MKLSEIAKNIILEYINSEMVSVKYYFTMSEEGRKEFLPEEYCSFFDDFLIEEDIDFTYPEDYDGNACEMIMDSGLDKDIYNAFADYLYEKLTSDTLPIPHEEYPAWTFFESVSLVKNQWLIHFTEDAEGIASQGFKYGIDEYTRLGLTTWISDFEKKYGGYNFAYTINDFRRYAGSGGRYKYGKEAVIFRASGIRAWHLGDSEFQTIFYGNTAKNIIPITTGDNSNWAIRGKRKGSSDVLYENDDLEKVVDWLINNYDQYRKSISSK